MFSFNPPPPARPPRPAPARMAGRAKNVCKMQKHLDSYRIDQKHIKNTFEIYLNHFFVFFVFFVHY